MLGSEKDISVPRSNLRRRRGRMGVKSELIFTPSQTRYVRQHIARLLRIICIRMNITNDEFDERHSQYWEIYGGADKDPGARTSQKGNIVKAIDPTSVTWTTFLKFATMILGLDILDLSVTVRDRTGEVRTFSTSDDLSDCTDDGPSDSDDDSDDD